MTVKREKLLNDATTTLDGAINASVTTVTVTDGSVFPATGNYRILVNSEIMLVTDRSTNDLTVERGIEGSTAASHSDLDPVTAIVTEGSLKQYWDDVSDFTPSASTPAKLVDASGNFLTSSSFTWYQQGTSTITDQSNGAMVLNVPDNAGGHQWRGMEITAPSTPWTIKLWLLIGYGYELGGTGTFWGCYMRETSSGNLITLHNKINATGASSDWDNATTFNNTNQSFDNGYDRAWFKLEDDGTNIIQSISVDDITYFEVLNEARGTHFTTGPDRVGFAMNAFNANESTVDMHILAWEET